MSFYTNIGHSYFTRLDPTTNMHNPKLQKNITAQFLGNKQLDISGMISNLKPTKKHITTHSEMINTIQNNL